MSNFYISTEHLVGKIITINIMLCIEIALYTVTNIKEVWSRELKLRAGLIFAIATTILFLTPVNTIADLSGEDGE